jgi:ABC-type uncharacterized transport system substrate-binding protein
MPWDCPKPIIATASLLLESGLVASLARPGGNVSGVTFFTAELNLKRLALLHELVPAALRVALLGDPSYMPAAHIADLTAAAHNLGLAVEVIEAGESRSAAAPAPVSASQRLKLQTYAAMWGLGQEREPVARIEDLCRNGWSGKCQ